MVCKQCKTEQGDNFPTGRTVCIECTKTRKKLWYQRNRQKQIEYSRQYKLNHAEEEAEKNRVRLRARYHSNPELAKLKHKEWKKNNKEAVKRANKSWRERNVERHKLMVRQNKAKLRAVTLKAYCKDGVLQCACCHEKDVRFLTIDHINNNGAEERRKIGQSRSFYNYLKNLGYPQNGYQVLCYNCNMAKRYTNVCPHKLPISEDPAWHKQAG